MKCQGRYGVIDTGLTIKKIKKEIQSTLTGDDIYGVWGFGSFFREERYNDIDILIVVKPGSKNALGEYYESKKRLDEISEKIGVPIDMTFLTYTEYCERPLLEMNNLLTIFENET
ncbi:nucleotidyltransferase domain-containing protein [Candidatus Thiosymbion oneisti]|uniref:nucleotidyltransferase domain-containing protein n=1 Tax=Candidatus Thiosymbion oneisti TaxID=589554 RepID=UPI0034E25102